MSATTPEGKVKRWVKDLFSTYKIWYFMPVAGGYGRAGIPDFVAIVRGQFIGVECKADATKKPTALQIKCGEDIINAGGAWFVVCDVVSLKTLHAFIEDKTLRATVPDKTGRK